uniref:DDE_Tnp_IS1595 domain-containing protein n=1 Tax=Strongyloides stercoralis TaxID=6248 RepID=A0A0K0EIY0_STRER
MFGTLECAGKFLYDSGIFPKNIEYKSKFDKRKYHRGHQDDEAWLLGGVEKTGQRKMYARVIEYWNEETFVDISKKHVFPSSGISTDCWKGYANLKDHGYIYHTVNHLICFKDIIIGIHTNSIEETWNR